MGMPARDPCELPRPQSARTLFLHERPGEPWSEMWIRRPPSRLEGLVGTLWAGDAEAAYACHRLLPNPELMLMLNLGTPQRVVEGTGCGQLYFDQSHLHRDFRELTGRKPSEYLGVRPEDGVGPAGVPN